MFEKEAEEYAKDIFCNVNCSIGHPRARSVNLLDVEQTYIDGAEYGYNKANEWHYVKYGDLPPEDTKVLALMAGGEVCIAHFYRKNVWDKIGIVIAWCEIPTFDKE